MGGKRGIGLTEVRALRPGQWVWDRTVTGLCARRQKGDAVNFVLKYRTKEGRTRWASIGRFGAPWTPDMAREEAKRLLGEVAKGGDPSGDKQARRHALTLAELCDEYYADATAGRVRTRHGAAKKSTTLAIDLGRIDRHVKPLIGGLAVTAVTCQDIERFLHNVAEGKTAGRTKTKFRGLARVTGGETAANRTVGLLGAIYSYAQRKGLRVDNPVRGVTLFADKKRERRFTDEEYARLGTALREAETTVWPPAVCAARFIALTGFRRGEALALKWSEIDLARRTAILSDTKSGKSIRPLSHPACDVLRGAPRAGGRVFPATRGDGPMAGFPGFWRRIAKLGDLPVDLTPHTLRHSYASTAADIGYSEPTIAALVGHKGRSTTSRYLHSADAVLLAAADAVAGRITALMGEGTPTGQVVPFPARP